MIMTTDPGHERRMFHRTAVTLETDIRFGGLDCTGFTADVSAQGAFVRASDEADPLLSLLQPGDNVELRVTMPLEEQLAIPARVVRKQDTGVGLKFQQPDDRFDSSQILATLGPVGPLDSVDPVDPVAPS